MRTHSDTYVTFVDLSAVDGCLLAEQVVGRAEKHPANPVLIPGDAEAWDSDRASNWAASIAWDPMQRQFTAWYYGTDRGSTVSFEAEHHSSIGYAVSDDGVVWEKPRLGLYDYRGSKDNNICFRPDGADASHFCVLIDPDAPDDRRYQALTWMPVADGGGEAAGNVFEGVTRRMRYVTHYSDDGIHWQRSGDGVQWPDGDTGHLFIDPTAPADGRIKAYGQHSVGEGPDIEHLVKQAQLPIDPQAGCGARDSLRLRAAAGRPLRDALRLQPLPAIPRPPGLHAPGQPEHDPPGPDQGEGGAAPRRAARRAGGRRVRHLYRGHPPGGERLRPRAVSARAAARAGRRPRRPQRMGLGLPGAGWRQRHRA